MKKDCRYLYRGVSSLIHTSNNGNIVPKETSVFKYLITLNDGWNLDMGLTLDSTENNAVIRHQHNQEGFPTSGISTTPLFERAKIYVNHKSKPCNGYIYKIDRHLLAEYKVKEYIVSEFTKFPSIPEDEEVILVSKDFRALPNEIIVDLIEIIR